MQTPHPAENTAELPCLGRLGLPTDLESTKQQLLSPHPPKDSRQVPNKALLHSVPGSLLEATCNVFSVSYKTELPPKSKPWDLIQYTHLMPLTGGIQGALG